MFEWRREGEGRCLGGVCSARSGCGVVGRGMQGSGVGGRTMSCLRVCSVFGLELLGEPDLLDEGGVGKGIEELFASPP